MKSSKRLAMLTLLALVSPAYAQMAPGPQDMQDIQVPPGRLFQKGFSLMPLNEKGWQINQRNPYQLMLDKPGGNPDEALMIQALVIKLPPFKSNEELVQQVKEVQVNDINLTRVSLLKYDLRPYVKKGRNCVRSHIAAEDRGAFEKSDKSGKKVMAEVVSLICAHPKNKQIGINVTYAQRYYMGQKDPVFLEKAEKLIDSIKFTGISGI